MVAEKYSGDGGDAVLYMRMREDLTMGNLWKGTLMV